MDLKKFGGIGFWKDILTIVFRNVWLLVSILSGSVIVFETTGDRISYNLCEMLSNTKFLILVGITILYSLWGYDFKVKEEDEKTASSSPATGDEEREDASLLIPADADSEKQGNTEEETVNGTNE